MNETQLFLPQDIFNRLTVSQLETIRKELFYIIKKVTNTAHDITIYRN